MSTQQAGGPPLGPFPADAGINDLGRQVLAVSWSMTALSGLVLALRVYCKAVRNRGLWWDDYVLIVSWICLLVPSITTTVEVQLGFGYHIFEINPRYLSDIGLLGQFTASLSILGALLSKTSFAITLLRITQGWTRAAVWFVIVSMNVAMVLSAIFTWVQCTPAAKFWNPMLSGTCWDPQVVPMYNTFSGVYSGVMDICLAMLPWSIILGLQMTQKEKFGVAIAMSMGVFAGATGFVKSSMIHTLASGDFTFFGTALVIWGAAETAATIIATSIPVLRALLSELKKNSSARYQQQSKHSGGNSLSTGRQWSTKNTNIITVQGRSHSSSTTILKDDAASDKTILAKGGPKIVKTSVVRIDYNDGRLRDEESGFEMGQFNT